jgi:hypothetical protein
VAQAVLAEGCGATDYVPTAACDARGADVAEDLRIATCELYDHCAPPAANQPPRRLPPTNRRPPAPTTG